MQNTVNCTGKYTVENTAKDDNKKNMPKFGSTFSDAVEANPVLKVMGINPDISAKSFAFLPPLLIADKFVNSRIGGKEENSILKKIANLGDKIYRLMGKNADKFGNFLTQNRLTKYFTEEYAAVPRSSFVTNVVKPEIGLANELASELASLKNKPEFAQYFGNGREALSRQTKDFINNIDTKNAVKDTDKLIKAADELIEKGVIKTQEGIFGGKDLSLMRNKLKAASSKMGETALGSAFAKVAHDTKSHLTFGGGIFGFTFVSFGLYNAFKEASDAPKGEKISTFMHCMSEEFIGFLIMQLATSPLYKLCGNKYRGMTPEARKELENIITKVNSNEKISKEALQIAKIQRDLLLQGINKDEVLRLENKSLADVKSIAKKLEASKKPDIKFWEKPLKFFGRILSTGLDEIQKPHYVNLPFIGKKQLPNPTLKGSLGGLGRLFAISFILTPILQKPITNLCHKLFGEPKTFIAKELGENMEEKPAIEQKPQNNKETNLLKKWTNLPEQSGLNTQSNSTVNTQPVQTAANNAAADKTNNIIASSNLSGKNNNEHKLYVPSINVDNSYLIEKENQINKRVNEILKNTDLTVSRLSKTLNN